MTKSSARKPSRLSQIQIPAIATIVVLVRGKEPTLVTLNFLNPTALNPTLYTPTPCDLRLGHSQQKVVHDLHPGARGFKGRL